MTEEFQFTIGDKVKGFIKDRIQQGYYELDGRLPSENELAEEFNVSRSSIRTALASLAAEHIIIRRQGDGTRINGEFANSLASFNKTWEFTKLIEFNGKKSSIQAISLLHRLPNLDEQKKLLLQPNNKVISIDRLFFADEEPAIFSNNVISENEVKNEINLEGANLSILEFVAHFCEQKLDYGLTNITVGMPSGNVASKLKMSVLCPVLIFNEVFFNEKSKPLVIAQSCFNPKKMELKIPRSFD